MKPEIIVALDVPNAAAVPPVLKRLPPETAWFKIGLELFTAEGPTIVRQLVQQGKHVFLDLKLHDIPRTVFNAVTSAASLGVDLMTVHAIGGRQMLQAAAEAASKAPHRPRLVAVTTLTSLNQDDFLDLGIQRTVSEQATALTRLALDSGLDGVVTSVLEASALRRHFGPEAILVTPGIRPSGAEVGDQKRVATPALAVEAGASYLVIGRPILDAPDPIAATRAIQAEIDHAWLRIKS
jgi:orotidine-5'-phosphate decarboxylase